MSYYNYSNPDKEYVREIFRNEVQSMEKKRLSNALYNPKDGWVYLEDPAFKPVRDIDPIPWSSYDKVQHVKTFSDNRQKYLNASISEDQVNYGHYHPQWQNEALLYHERIKQRGAGVINSTEFPAITVTSTATELQNI